MNRIKLYLPIKNAKCCFQFKWHNLLVVAKKEKKDRKEKKGEKKKEDIFVLLPFMNINMVVM